MHLAQGLMKKIIVNRMTKAGFTFLLFVADWFALLNLKMGGRMEDIQTTGRYLIEVWKALGMDMTRVRFVICSEEMRKHHDSYWGHVVNIASKNTVERLKHAVGALGRSKNDKLMASQLMYVAMQVGDVFHLGVDVAQLGLDQRKVNVIAREYVGHDSGLKPPIVLSHPMIPGLKKGAGKASKSDPMSAMFCEDTEDEINAKIKAAYCPPPADAIKRSAELKKQQQQTSSGSAGAGKGKKKTNDDDDDNVPKQLDGLDDNPIMAHFEHIVFPLEKDGVTLVEAKSPRHFKNYQLLKESYLADQIDPIVLKATLAACINRLLEPVRAHFINDPVARDLGARVKALRSTPPQTASAGSQSTAAAPAAATKSNL